MAKVKITFPKILMEMSHIYYHSYKLVYRFIKYFICWVYLQYGTLTFTHTYQNKRDYCIWLWDQIIFKKLTFNHQHVKTLKNHIQIEIKWFHLIFYCKSSYQVKIYSHVFANFLASPDDFGSFWLTRINATQQNNCYNFLFKAKIHL